MFPRAARPQRSKRQNYHALNDGTDEEVEPKDRITNPEDHISKKICMANTCSSDSSEIVDIESRDDDAASRQAGSRNLQTQGEDGRAEQDSLGNDLTNEDEPARRNIRHEVLSSEFRIEYTPGMSYISKDSGKRFQEGTTKCTRCSWSMKESIRDGSTSNLQTSEEAPKIHR